MKCNNCGNEVFENQKFCSKCGHPLSSDEYYISRYNDYVKANGLNYYSDNEYEQAVKKKKRTRRIEIGICCIVLFFVIVALTCDSNIESEPSTPMVYSDVALEKAEEIFHKNYKFKNESSYVINESKVTYDKELFENENSTYTTVTVYVDYSAQNGFGGMNRNSYTVNFLFDKATGEYTFKNLNLDNNW